MYIGVLKQYILIATVRVKNRQTDTESGLRCLVPRPLTGLRFVKRKLGRDQKHREKKKKERDVSFGFAPNKQVEKR